MLKLAWFIYLLSLEWALPEAQSLGAESKDLNSKSTVLVSTALGTISGKREGQVNAFLGIPFAEPPTGTFRFRPPRPKRAWSPKTHYAHTYSPECLQSSLYASVDSDGTSMDEDCLYLNIWVPAKPKEKGLLPVLLWVYGGAFLHGGASKPEYVGDQLAARGVIVVSCNYRLGALGFLVSTSDGLYGNYGLADQKLAMMWVQDHIRNFGGDPTRITLFGESAGAMSIGLHFLDQEYQQQRLLRTNPRQPRKWLFHAIILQSNPLGYRYRALAVANFLGAAYKDRLDCEDLRCLQSESADELIHVQDTLMAVPRSIGDFFTWGPVVTDHHYWREFRLRPGPESNITVRQPIEAMGDLVRLGRRLDVPVVMGTTKDEGRVFVFTAFGTHMPKLIYQAVVFSFFRGSALRVLKQYAALSEREADGPYPDYRPVLSTIIGDYLFRCPNQLFASQLTAANTSVFLYEFALPTRTPGYPCCDGLACHTAELPYVFNQVKVIDDEYSWQAPPELIVDFPGAAADSLFNNREGENRFAFPDIFGAASSWFGAQSGQSRQEEKPRILIDTNVSNFMSDYWTTFATYGDPNGLPNPPNGYLGTTRPQGAPWWPTLMGDLLSIAKSPPRGGSDDVGRKKTAAGSNGGRSSPEEYDKHPSRTPSSAAELEARKRKERRRVEYNDQDDDNDDGPSFDDDGEGEYDDLVSEVAIRPDGGDQSVRVRRMRPQRTPSSQRQPKGASSGSKDDRGDIRGGAGGAMAGPHKRSFFDATTAAVTRRNVDKPMHIVKFDDITEVMMLENDCTCQMWHNLGYQF